MKVLVTPSTAPLHEEQTDTGDSSSLLSLLTMSQHHLKETTSPEEFRCLETDRPTDTQH